MSQNVVDFSQNPTGPELMDNFLAKVQENLKTCNSGISRPSYAVKGTFWLDTSVTPHLLKQYDGSDDVVLGSIDITNHVFTPNSPLLTNGGTDKYVLTANGVGNAPTYQKNPIGVYEYSSSRTYGLNDFVMQYDSTDEKVKLYRSIVADNLNNPLSDTTKWEEVSLGGDEGMSSRNIGEIVQSTIPLTDAGLHLLDGGVIQGGGAYDAFVNYIVGLVNLYPNLFTTETDWQTAVTTYGVCGKFVYDSTNNTVRLPKITGFTEGTIDTTVLGDLVEAGLPNITGTVSNVSGVNKARTVTGAFTSSNYATGVSMGGGQNYKANGDIGFDASLSNSIYGNSDTVQPQAIKVLYYIVIATSTKTNIEVDIDEVMTDLNGKVDNANLATIYPVIETYVNGTSWYRVYSDGWVEQGGRFSSADQTNTTVTFLKPFANTDYTPIVGQQFGLNGQTQYRTFNISTISSDSMVVHNTTNGTNTCIWMACGYGA